MTTLSGTPAMLWSLADMLGMNINFARANQTILIAGQDPKQAVKCGPWEVDLVKLLRSDFCSETKCGVFFKVRKNLWLYIVAMPGVLIAYLVDAKLAGLQTEKMSAAGAGSVEETLKKIGAGVKGAFCYNSGERKWETYVGNVAVGEGSPEGLDEQPRGSNTALPGDQAPVL